MPNDEMPSASSRILNLLEHEKPEGDYNAGDVADKVAKYILDTDPELVLEWADQRLHEWLRNVLIRQDHSRRSRFRAVARRQEFVEAYDEAAKKKDVAALRRMRTNIFSQWFVVIDEHNTRRALGRLTRDDLGFAASALETQAAAATVTASFYRALQNAVPAGKTVEDVFTPEAVTDLMERFAA